MEQVKAVYLHVLASNAAAIKFYEKHHFQKHIFLPYYYHIGGKSLSQDINWYGQSPHRLEAMTYAYKKIKIWINILTLCPAMDHKWPHVVLPGRITAWEQGHIWDTFWLKMCLNILYYYINLYVAVYQTLPVVKL